MTTLYLLLLLMPTLLAASNFWMTAHLIEVVWREGCLTTAGCHQPRFKLLEDMLPLSEKQSISWPVSEHFVQESPRSLVSFWPSGKPEDVSISCQVVGTDPTYGFPRVCDQTASNRVFQDVLHETYDRLRSRRHQTTTPLPDEEKGKIIIELRGKCFNATLAVQKHTERCPWCPDPAEVTVIGQEIVDDSPLASSILSQLQGEDRLIHIGIAALAGVAALTSAAFAVLLVVFMRQKKSHRQISVKPRYQPYSPALVKITDDESRYDLPWETCPHPQQQRNLAYWQSRSESTTTSPLDSASSLGRYNYRIPGVVPPVPNSLCPTSTALYQHIQSPNSSLGAHDSGLDSV